MILIIDNYDSFTYNLVHLIARHASAYEVHRNDKITVEEVLQKKPEKILISPGPGRPEQAGITQELIQAVHKEIPVLGVCLGHQAIGQVFGAKIISAPSLMHGKTSDIIHDGTGIYDGIPSGFTATRYHSLVIEEGSIPKEHFEITSRSEDGIVMGIRHREYPLEGVQFHPESILTTCGPQLIENWMKPTLTTIRS
ncbi:aminodeoxychorismate/anthranilate synthase component II [Balneolaceae bacterium ANBcel3]|nr:aminodeoxychorismate/anthranilate synthase component II [Balneolaceae bacterium ANBcel3]